MNRTEFYKLSKGLSVPEGWTLRAIVPPASRGRVGAEIAAAGGQCFDAEGLLVEHRDPETRKRTAGLVVALIPLSDNIAWVGLPMDFGSVLKQWRTNNGNWEGKSRAVRSIIEPDA